jgi:hypothetical protein
MGTLRKWREDSGIPFIKIKRRYRFPLNQIEDWERRHLINGK